MRGRILRRMPAQDVESHMRQALRPLLLDGHDRVTPRDRRPRIHAGWDLTRPPIRRSERDRCPARLAGSIGERLVRHAFEPVSSRDHSCDGLLERTGELQGPLFHPLHDRRGSLPE